MPRGSRPGERRGGRQRATPNKRTVLTDRILAAVSCHGTATRHELILVLVEDGALPADTRMAVARKNDPPRATNAAARGAKTEAMTFETLDLLLRIARDAAATPAERRKAAAQLAGYFLPKNPRGRTRRRSVFPKDEYGFAVDPVLAGELRDSQLRLDRLRRSNKLTPYTVAQRARKIQARIRAIQQSLECPCPSKYGVNEFQRDRERLDFFHRRRESRKILAFEEEIEEAHRIARHDSFWLGPEATARRRLTELRAKKRAADIAGGRPLTHAEKALLRCLTLLYPLRRPPSPNPQALAEHPFQALPISEGEPSPPISDTRLAEATADACHAPFDAPQHSDRTILIDTEEWCLP
jgi:hypothetical protein